MGRHDAYVQEEEVIQSPPLHTERYARVTKLTDAERGQFLGALTRMTLAQGNTYSYFQPTNSELHDAAERTLRDASTAPDSLHGVASHTPTETIAETTATPPYPENPHPLDLALQGLTETASRHHQERHKFRWFGLGTR